MSQTHTGLTLTTQTRMETDMCIFLWRDGKELNLKTSSDLQLAPLAEPYF